MVDARSIAWASLLVNPLDAWSLLSFIVSTEPMNLKPPSSVAASDGDWHAHARHNAMKVAIATRDTTCSSSLRSTCSSAFPRLRMVLRLRAPVHATRHAIAFVSPLHGGSAGARKGFRRPREDR